MKRLLTLLVVLVVPAAMADWTGIPVAIPDFNGTTPSGDPWTHEVTLPVAAGETVYGVALDMDFHCPDYYPGNYLGIQVTPPNTADQWMWPGANYPNPFGSGSSGTIEYYGGTTTETFSSDRHFWNASWTSGTASGGDWTFRFTVGNGWGRVNGTNTTMTLITEPIATSLTDPRVFEGILPANTTVYDEVGGGYRMVATRTGIHYGVEGAEGYRMWQGSDNVWQINYPGGPGTVTITRPSGQGDSTRWSMFDSATPAYAWYLSPNFVAVTRPPPLSRPTSISRRAPTTSTWTR